MPHNHANDQQGMYRYMITTATTAYNIWLIVETIIASHMGMAYHVEHTAQGMPLNHRFSLLISVECVCVKDYPWVFCTQ